MAAYARVSSDSTDQQNSFAAQVAHFTELIGKNKDWEMVDVYADEGLTGLRADKFITCKAPFGYRLEQGQLVIDGNEATIVRWIFDSFLSGMGRREIVDRLNQTAVPKRYDSPQ